MRDTRQRAPASESDGASLQRRRMAGSTSHRHEGTQATRAMKEDLAIQFRLNPNRVRVLAPYVGGGFGLLGAISPHTTLDAFAARRMGCPRHASTLHFRHR
jgi:CO/xanthine dehydrogenase Mo-binding subunit